MSHFSVKNFEKFQHYKDRSPPWIKLYNELLDDYEFGRLPDASKMHLVAIWLLASRYDNRIPADAEWVARRINATDPVDLLALAKAGFIVMDQDSDTDSLAVLAPRKQAAMPEREGEKELEKRQREKNAPAAPTARDELLQVLDSERTEAVLEHRQKLRKPLTPRGAKLLAEKFSRCRDGPNAAADAVVANGWLGFEPEWLDKRNGRKPSDLDNRRANSDAIDEVVAMAEARQRVMGTDADR